MEIDELWSFVRRKSQQVWVWVWVWVAISYQSRQVLAMVVGDRSARTCRKLWERLPESYKSLLIYTDFYKAYLAVIPSEQHKPSRKGSGHTNTVERFNLTLRQRVGRCVRKTLSFSRSPAMHLLCLRIFVDNYNRYCIKRFKLLTTPIEP